MRKVLNYFSFAWIDCSIDIIFQYEINADIFVVVFISISYCTFVILYLTHVRLWPWEIWIINTKNARPWAEETCLIGLNGSKLAIEAKVHKSMLSYWISTTMKSSYHFMGWQAYHITIFNLFFQHFVQYVLCIPICFICFCIRIIIIIRCFLYMYIFFRFS